MIYVSFGSETGNSEEIAKQLQIELINIKLNPNLVVLNKFTKELGMWVLEFGIMLRYSAGGESPGYRG